MKKVNPVQLYNTHYEVGVRLLIILNNGKTSMSLERLQIYDYAILHLGDIQENYSSIHPSNPSHSSEIIAKKQLVRAALATMAIKGLTTVLCTSTGFVYAANKMTEEFLQMLSSNYSHQVCANSKIVCDLFSDYTDSQLGNFADIGLQNWAGEIEKSYSLRGRQYE